MFALVDKQRLLHDILFSRFATEALIARYGPCILELLCLKSAGSCSMLGRGGERETATHWCKVSGQYCSCAQQDGSHRPKSRDGSRHGGSRHGGRHGFPLEFTFRAHHKGGLDGSRRGDSRRGTGVIRSSSTGSLGGVSGLDTPLDSEVQPLCSCVASIRVSHACRNTPRLGRIAIPVVASNYEAQADSTPDCCWSKPRLEVPLNRGC